jgi:hypothetical protein
VLHRGWADKDPRLDVLRFEVGVLISSLLGCYGEELCGKISFILAFPFNIYWLCTYVACQNFIMPPCHVLLFCYHLILYIFRE